MSNDNDGPKVLPFRPRGAGPNGPLNPPEAPKLPQDEYRIVQYDRNGGEIEYLKSGHIIVTNINIALLDEDSELMWSIPNNQDLKFLERIDSVDVELEDDSEDYNDDLPSESDEDEI